LTGGGVGGGGVLEGAGCGIQIAQWKLIKKIYTKKMKGQKQSFKLLKQPLRNLKMMFHH